MTPAPIPPGDDGYAGRYARLFLVHRDSFGRQIFRCEICDAVRYKRQGVVQHAKRHERAGEALVIPGRQRFTAEDRYGIADNQARSLRSPSTETPDNG